MPGGLPPEVNNLLTEIQVYSMGVVTGLAACMAMVAGLMRVLGLKEEGKRRYKDAIIGMAMVMTAPAVIGFIATILKAFFPQTFV